MAEKEKRKNSGLQEGITPFGYDDVFETEGDSMDEWDRAFSETEKDIFQKKQQADAMRRQQEMEARAAHQAAVTETLRGIREILCWEPGRKTNKELKNFLITKDQEKQLFYLQDDFLAGLKEILQEIQLDRGEFQVLLNVYDFHLDPKLPEYKTYLKTRSWLLEQKKEAPDRPLPPFDLSRYLLEMLLLFAIIYLPGECPARYAWLICAITTASHLLLRFFRSKLHLRKWGALNLRSYISLFVITLTMNRFLGQLDSEPDGLMIYFSFSMLIFSSHLIISLIRAIGGSVFETEKKQIKMKPFVLCGIKRRRRADLFCSS